MVNGGTVSLYVRNLQSGADTLVDTGVYTGPTGEGLYGGALSADGRYIVYAKGLKSSESDANQNNDSVLLVKDLQAEPGAAAIDVTPPKPASGDLNFVAEYDVYGISQDGNEILYQEIDDAKTGLSGSAAPFVYNRTTGTRTTPDPTGSDIGSTDVDRASITPDGQSVVLNYGNGDNKVITLPQTVRGEFAGLTGARISDDGRYIALGRQNSSPPVSEFTQVHDITLPNSPDKVVSGQLLAFSGNGRVVAVADPVSGPNGQTLYDLDLKNIDTGATTTIGTITDTDFGNGIGQHFSLSYDASVAVYNSGTGIAITTLPPLTVTIKAVAGDDFINGHEPTVTVSGTSDAIGQTVHLSIEGTTDTASAVVQANGTWSTLWFIETPPSPDGAHVIDATITDTLGRSATVSQDVVVDTTPPSLVLYSINGGATVNAAEASSITILGFATDGSPNPDGTSDEAGQPVSLSVDNHSIGAPKVLQNGVWVLQYDGASLTDGQHELEYSVADRAGNVTKSSIYFNVDQTPPKIAITSIGDQDVVTAGDYQNGAVIKGTSDAIGSTVDVTVNYSNLAATVAADGTWQATATFNGSPPGWQTVTATVFDDAGNVGTTTSSALVENGIIEVSTTATGVSGTGTSSDESVSGDGRIVAFAGDQPEISGLVPVTDTAASLAVDARVIYVKTIQTGAISVISKMLDGAAPDGDSWRPAVSQNGRFVAFLSDATNLVAGDTNGPGTVAGLGDQTPGVDVFETDLSTGVTQRVDTTSSGGQVDGTTVDEVADERPAISADGRYVAFVSDATGLVDGVSGTQIYLKDLQTGTVSLVSTDSSGAALTGPNVFPSMSADGRYVAFLSGYADPNTVSNLIVRDMQTGTSTLVSSTAVTAANLSLSDQRDGHLAISPDGQYVAFDRSTSDSASLYGIQTVIRNLATGQETTIPDVYVAGGFSSDNRFITVIQREENGDFGNIELFDQKTGALSVLPGVLEPGS